MISTLAAFGGSDAAIENLRQLRAAGVTVLYGTDLGNQRDAGPSADELALLRRAGARRCGDHRGDDDRAC